MDARQIDGLAERLKEAKGVEYGNTGLRNQRKILHEALEEIAIEEVDYVRGHGAPRSVRDFFGT